MGTQTHERTSRGMNQGSDARPLSATRSAGALMMQGTNPTETLPKAPVPSSPKTVEEWLCSLDTSGRYDKYLPKFKEHFDDLEALCVAAAEYGFPAILDECGVKSLGHRAMIKQAMETLSCSPTVMRCAGSGTGSDAPSAGCRTLATS